jgi:enediyne biosynthesis protein E4
MKRPHPIPRRSLGSASSTTRWLSTLWIALAFLASIVRAQDPAISTEPADAVASLGGDVTFTLRATATQPLWLQWFHTDGTSETALMGTNVLSHASTTLTLTQVELADAGGYYAVITNDLGSVTSRVAQLTVDPTFIKVTGQPIVEDREPSEVGIWCDYNHDGFMDLFVSNHHSALPIYTNSLYRNEGDGTFTRILDAPPSAPLNTWGACWGDYDNDGHPDLVIVPFGGSGARLYRGDGNGGFAHVHSADFSGASQVDAAWADLDRDGWLDLFICNWAGLKDLAYRNLGDGRFHRLTAGEVGALVEDAATTGPPSFADFDNDGDPDLYVCREDGRGFLYRNDGKGFFEKVMLGSLATIANNGATGVWADFDNDGYFDLFTGAGSAAPGLHRNLEGLTFQDVTEVAGLLMPSGLAWGPAWGDVDNDGDLDLFVPYHNATNVFFLNNGNGTFTASELGSPLREGVRAGSASWMDYDNDGFLDLFVACGENHPTPNLLYRNNLPTGGNANHWLKVRLTGTVSSHLAIGAKIRVRAVIQGRETWQLRQIASNGAFASGAELIAHFGLGDATIVERVIIEWPSGNVTELIGQAANQTLSIRETVSITPARPSASLNGSVTLSIRGPKLQWQFEGVDLPGQTNRNLVLTNLTAEQAGRYSVLVDNGTTVVTNFTYLTVDPTFTKITEGSPVTDLGCSWGAAWGDYDEDGYPDLFVARNNLGHAAVYRGQPDGSFATVPDLPFSDSLDAWASGAWADFDKDGRQDLLVTRFDNRPTHLYFNNGDGGFNSLPLNTAANWGIALADYDRDGLLDVLFSTGVTANGSAPAILYRNDSQRGFVRMNSAEVGPLVTLATFGAAIWVDYDDDGWMDVYAPHWQGPSVLFRNDGTGRFVSVRNAVTQAAQSIAGAWGDYDNDGRLDLCAVSWGSPAQVYRNLGNGEFERADIGVTLSDHYASAYWIDYDNDGLLDLFVAGQGNNALYRQSGQGTFTRIRLGSLANEVPVNGALSYSALWFDYDNNGFLDLYVSNGDDPRSITTANFLYRNNGNDNGWLKVKLIGTTSNREGIGAKVRMLPLGRGQLWQRRDISGGDGYNGNQLYAHFGLGSATSVKTLRIEWPSGIVQELQNIPAKQTITVIEPCLQAAFDDAGAFRIAVTCDPHRSYGLEVSTDLVEWTNVAHFTEGSGVYTENLPPTQRRFYRLR